MIAGIISAFQSFLPCGWKPEEAQIEALQALSDYADRNGFTQNTEYEAVFVEAVNQKLALNDAAYKHILDVAFREKIKMNYALKTRIKALLDGNDKAAYRTFLEDNSIFTDDVFAAFSPVSKDVTMKALANVVASDEQYDSVISAIFSRFCFHLYERPCAFRFFSGEEIANEAYFAFIGAKYPDMCERSAALGIIDVTESLFIESYEAGCNRVFHAIRDAYENLNNHCDLAVYIPDLLFCRDAVQWRLYADVILYAEKCVKEKIDKTYFRWKKIGDQTCAYIERLVPHSAAFAYAFQGFVFKDCFVIGNGGKGGYALLLIFEKNKRDERRLNCPACRTSHVQGNSYPILNVRSWECENPLCPDRSKYNRGKRFAFMSLYRQMQMQQDDNVIPEESISQWHLDCVDNASKRDALEMVVRHYSCVDDGVVLYGDSQNQHSVEAFGRRLRYKRFAPATADLLSEFKSSAYFYRYLQNNDRTIAPADRWDFDKAIVYWGDALDVLRAMPDACIDGAVTSPPYYNAKSYSQWPNIYCYLFDMYNIAKEVFRVMKDGAVYLYNIFDYFDNENNIVLSAMGNKRMILGAYMIDIFERVGFEIRGNIIWNKGEIQGSRSFNQGNLTPYYQAPLNCWEHILIVSKGKPDKKFKKIVSRIQDTRPVIKMIHGKNILGHDAPFPPEIPEMLIKHMDRGDTVLDPFLGSGTTSIVANGCGVNSIGIEKNGNYFTLCREKITDAARRLSLL